MGCTINRTVAGGGDMIIKINVIVGFVYLAITLYFGFVLNWSLVGRLFKNLEL